MSDKPESGAADISSDRDAICDEAGKDLFFWANEWKVRHGLTDSEVSYIIGVLNVRHQQAVCIKEREGKHGG